MINQAHFHIRDSSAVAEARMWLLRRGVAAEHIDAG